MRNVIEIYTCDVCKSELSSATNARMHIVMEIGQYNSGVAVPPSELVIRGGSKWTIIPFKVKQAQLQFCDEKCLAEYFGARIQEVKLKMLKQ